MKQVSNLKKLQDLPLFDSQTIGQITGLDSQILDNTITRWTKGGALIRLKKGLYTTGSFYDLNKSSRYYREYLSNKLRYPSYLSLEYVLSNYQVLTQATFNITAITTKTTRNYKNVLGIFSYQSISQELFTGYSIQSFDGYDIAIASKSKALFDYLYLKLYRVKQISKLTIKELRLNLDEFDQEEKLEFEQYCRLINIKKFLELSNLLFL